MCLVIVGSLFSGSARAQDSPSQEPQPANQPAPAASVATVHGVVRNGASGEPLSHALVRINGDAASAVLTDGEGRFEIADVPEGPQEFTVVKPGFLDQVEAVADSVAWNARGYGHNIIVVREMGDVVFTMEPLNSIRGQIQLSTGDVAQGIVVSLLRRTVQDGRVVWQSVGNTKTNSEGAYRFGELSDGLYAVYTEPTMDSEASANLVENNSAGKVTREGYASVFYPDARDLAGAAKMPLSGGEQAQANISLTLEPFQPVKAAITFPGAAQGSGDSVSVQVMDAQGHPLSYTAQYDSSTRTAQAALPDGTYTMLATMMSSMMHVMSVRNANTFVALSPRMSRPITGEVSFAVAGRPVSSLRIPMAAVDSNPIQITLARSQGGATEETHVFVTLSLTGGWLSDGMVVSYAEGTSSLPLPTTPAQPGSYWVHTSIAQKGLCESSFTAGGASLAHEPLVLGLSGTTAPLVLALRDDCAKLAVSLPGSVGPNPGEERNYTVYVVPDFDSTQDVVPQTLRFSTGGTIRFNGLTPGNYHVYTFDRPMALEYRNRAVLASLRGQAVSLAPSADAELIVEVPR